MINPRTLVDAVTSTLRNIPDLVKILGGDPNRISAFHYQYGKQHQLANAVYTMPNNTILVAWDSTKGGNFDGSTIHKHRVVLYFRAGNQVEKTTPATQASYEDIWWTAMHGAITGYPGGQNIRQIQVLPNVDVMDVPSVGHQIDENKADYFQGVCDFPEIGDD